MTVVGSDSCFQIFGIMSVAQHRGIIVGLDYYKLSLSHVIVHAPGYIAEVGSYCDGFVAVGNEESGIVSPVVGDIKCRPILNGNSL